MGLDLHVSALANGDHALRAIGGNTMNGTLAEFPTRHEAEHAMLHRLLHAAPDAGLMTPD